MRLLLRHGDDPDTLHVDDQTALDWALLHDTAEAREHVIAALTAAGRKPGSGG